jgi:ATP-dependent protease Clp ATPase subunit
MGSEAISDMRNVEDSMANEKLSCTFCHKGQDEVVAILAFPADLSICNECVWLMVEIIAQRHPEWRDQTLKKLMEISN